MPQETSSASNGGSRKRTVWVLRLPFNARRHPRSPRQPSHSGGTPARALSSTGVPRELSILHRFYVAFEWTNHFIKRQFETVRTVGFSRGKGPRRVGSLDRLVHPV